MLTTLSEISICIVERNYQYPFEMFPIPTQNARRTRDEFFLLKQGSGSPLVGKFKTTNTKELQICIASSLTGLRKKMDSTSLIVAYSATQRTL